MLNGEGLFEGDELPDEIFEEDPEEMLGAEGELIEGALELIDGAEGALELIDGAEGALELIDGAECALELINGADTGKPYFLLDE